MKKNITFGSWLILSAFSKDTERLRLSKMSRPQKVGDVTTPTNLDDMTIGQMVQLSTLQTDGEMFYKVCEVLLSMNPEVVNVCKATEVVSFVGWVYGRIEKINALFDKAKRKPTDKEIRAGINKLQFGIFGMIDWYALRMGITDHEEVMRVPWMRVYQCLSMDNQKQEFEKRLSDIYNDEHRR